MTCLSVCVHGPQLYELRAPAPSSNVVRQTCCSGAWFCPIRGGFFLDVMKPEDRSA